LISKTAKSNLSTMDHLAKLLEADKDWTDEWGRRVFNEICAFNSRD
jgi:hypothetical protein